MSISVCTCYSKLNNPGVLTLLFTLCHINLDLSESVNDPSLTLISVIIIQHKRPNSDIICPALFTRLA